MIALMRHNISIHYLRIYYLPGIYFFVNGCIIWKAYQYSFYPQNYLPELLQRQGKQICLLKRQLRQLGHKALRVIE